MEKKVIKFWKQYCSTGALIGDNVGSYYGVINGRFDYWDIDEVQQSNAEIIKLPEEKIYPRVMLVSHDKIKWYKRVVFMEKRGEFLAWYNAETMEDAENTTDVFSWEYAKEIEPVEVTLEEIAKWKGVSKEQIIIKQWVRKKQQTKN